jgi:hypothetical protein
MPNSYVGPWPSSAKAVVLALSVAVSALAEGAARAEDVAPPPVVALARAPERPVAVQETVQAGALPVAVTSPREAPQREGAPREADGPAVTAYCDRVRARAASDAALLMAPRVVVQGLRFARAEPQLYGGQTVGNGYQIRTGLTFSPLDFYKGLNTLELGNSDCDRHTAAHRLQDVLEHGSDVARLSALRAQAQYLRSRQADWRGLEGQAAARLSGRIITLLDFNTVQQFVDNLEHKLVQVESQEGQLKVGIPASALSPEPLSALRSRYLDEELRFERETAQLKRADAWKAQLTGGVVPLAPVDWYGAVELSFNIGGLAQPREDRRALTARATELTTAGDELPGRLERYRRQMQVALEESRRELRVVQHSIEVINSTRLILDRSDAESVAQARELLTIQQVAVESDAVFQRALVSALEALTAQADR